MTPTNMSQAQAHFQQLSSRADALNERLNKVQVKVEAARQQLAAAEAEAVNAFGTANLDELREKLRHYEQANATVTADFELALNKLEEHLTSMEKALTDPEYLNELLLKMGRAGLDTAASPVVAAAPSAAPQAEEVDI